MKKTLVTASAVGIVAGSVLIASPSFAHSADFVKNCQGITFNLSNYSAKPEVSHVVHHEAVYGQPTLITPAQPEVPEVSHIVHHEAVTEEVTVTDKAAYDEDVIDVPEHTATVVDVPETTVTVVDQEAYDEKVIDVAYQPAQEAVYGDAPLITAAYDEKVIDQAYVPGKAAVPAQPAVYGPKPIITPAVPAVPAIPAKPAVTHVEVLWVKKNIWQQVTASVWVKEGQKPSGSGWIKTSDCKTVIDQAAVPAVPAIPAKPAVYGDAPLITPAVPAQPAVPEVPEVSHVVHHEAVYGEKPLITPAKDAVQEVSHVVHHEAVTHEVTVPAVTHEVTVPATYKTVHHEAETHVETKTITAAYDEKVIDQKFEPAVEAVYGEAPLITPAKDETVVDQKADAEPNTVSWIAGGQHGAAQFGESFSKTISFEDTTKANTYTVDVVAWDDPTGDKGWTTQWTGMTEACPSTPPTEEPTPPVTTPPTDEPSTPTPSDEPSDNPTKPAAVVPVKNDTPKPPRHRAETVVTPQAQAKTLAYTGAEGMTQGLIGAGVLLLTGGALAGITRKRRRSNSHEVKGRRELLSGPLAFPEEDTKCPPLCGHDTLYDLLLRGTCSYPVPSR